MCRDIKAGVILSICVLLQAGFAGGASAAESGTLRVVSDQRAGGFVFPESVGCDAGS